MSTLGSNINAIKDRLKIITLVEGVTRLGKFGKSLKGLCPFHSEKSPSFYVYPEKNRFKCYGCGEEGSALDFYAKVNGKSLGDAVKSLEEQFGFEAAEKPKQMPLLSRTEYADLGLVPHMIRDLFHEDMEMHDDIVKGKIREKIQVLDSMARVSPPGLVQRACVEQRDVYLGMWRKIPSPAEGRVA